jgi:hypothetical protein
MLSHASSLRVLLFFFLWTLAFRLNSSSSLVYSRLAPEAARLYSIARHISLLLHPTIVYYRRQIPSRCTTFGVRGSERVQSNGRCIERVLSV